MEPPQMTKSATKDANLAFLLGRTPRLTDDGEPTHTEAALGQPVFFSPRKRRPRPGGWSDRGFQREIAGFDHPLRCSANMLIAVVRLVGHSHWIGMQDPKSTLELSGPSSAPASKRAS